MNWPRNKLHISNLSWRQIFSQSIFPRILYVTRTFVTDINIDVLPLLYQGFTISTCIGFVSVGIADYTVGSREMDYAQHWKQSKFYFCIQFRLYKGKKHIVVVVCSNNNQGSKGIRQWPINWYTSLMIIHKITPSVD